MIRYIDMEQDNRIPLLAVIAVERLGVSADAL
jgi:hypothetical protein